MSKREIESWQERGTSGPATDAVAAATVVLVRDVPASDEAAGGVETLMVRRNSKLEFAGGMWVFPGGRVDPEDIPVGGDEIEAARAAAVREAQEEAGLLIDGAALVPFSHWEPPEIAPKRFATWFFVGPAPSGRVTIDGGEIHDHQWVSPSGALALRDAGEIELAPPTWVTLFDLSVRTDVADVLQDAADREIEFFVTHVARVDDGMVALWHGDAGYESGDASHAGPRHRLWMVASGWRYERSN